MFYLFKRRVTRYDGGSINLDATYSFFSGLDIFFERWFGKRQAGVDPFLQICFMYVPFIICPHHYVNYFPQIILFEENMTFKFGPLAFKSVATPVCGSGNFRFFSCRLCNNCSTLNKEYKNWRHPVWDVSSLRESTLLWVAKRWQKWPWEDKLIYNLLSQTVRDGSASQWVDHSHLAYNRFSLHRRFVHPQVVSVWNRRGG